VTTNPFLPLAEMIADLVVKRLEAREQRLMTLSQAAVYLQKSPSWLRAEIAAKRIECVRAHGKGRPRLDRAVLDRWIEKHSGGA
jgi:excisionase family DNA binding protein